MINAAAGRMLPADLHYAIHSLIGFTTAHSGSFVNGAIDKLADRWNPLTVAALFATHVASAPAF